MRWHGLARWTEQLVQVRHPLEMHQALTRLLPLLEADGVLLFLNDTLTHQQQVFSAGLSPHAHRFMQQHSDEDQYLKCYLAQGLVGHSVPLQRLLDNDEEARMRFLARFTPHFPYRHSLGLILPLSPHRHIGLSCHRATTPFGAGSEGTLSAVGATLLPWAHLWLGPTEARKDLALTLAETQILDLLLQGLDGSEIAQRRGVSKETVKSQIKALLHKTECRHQNQLISKMHGITPTGVEWA